MYHFVFCGTVFQVPATIFCLLFFSVWFLQPSQLHAYTFWFTKILKPILRKSLPNQTTCCKAGHAIAIDKERNECICNSSCMCVLSLNLFAFTFCRPSPSLRGPAGNILPVISHQHVADVVGGRVLWTSALRVCVCVCVCVCVWCEGMCVFVAWTWAMCLCYTRMGLSHEHSPKHNIRWDWIRENWIPRVLCGPCGPQCKT
jgi:hypothetical protein